MKMRREPPPPPLPPDERCEECGRVFPRPGETADFIAVCTQPVMMRGNNAASSVKCQIVSQQREGGG